MSIMITRGLKVMQAVNLDCAAAKTSVGRLFSTNIDLHIVYKEEIHTLVEFH